MGCLEEICEDEYHPVGLDLDIFYRYKRICDVIFKDEEWKIRKAKMIEIEEEDKIVTPKFKKKMEELISKRENSKPRIIAEGNYCKKPCYEYNTNLLETCPKCGGIVLNRIENEMSGDSFLPGCCEKFTYKNLDKIDYDIKEFFKYFEKYDEKKERYYIIIDGDRLDIPKYLNFKNYLTANFSYFFPPYNKKYADDYNLDIDEYGKSLGYRQIFTYAYCARQFICNKCKYEFHILRTLPFMYRDKNKDNIIMENPDEENNEEK